MAAVLVPLGVTERGVVVEADLGVEGVHLAGRLQDQRVDLGEVAVALGEAAVELDEDVGGAVERPLGQLRVDAGLAGRREVEAVDRVDVQHDDRVGVGLGDGLDLDATLGGQHQEVLLGRAVEGEAGVVLLVDVARVLDPDPLDEMALDVHAEDVPGVLADLVGVVGELDAAGLAAATDLHLGLDDDGVAGLVGLRDRLVDGVGHATPADRDVVAGEVLLALVLEEIHVGVLAFLVIRSGVFSRFRVRRAPARARDRWP